MYELKGFKLDENGDISITDGHIDMVSDIELEKQTIKTVLQTNKGEWPLNKDEGIDFNQIQGKGITKDMIYTQVQSGIRQVNNERTIDEFSHTIKNRHLTVNITAQKSDGSSISIEKEWD